VSRNLRGRLNRLERIEPRRHTASAIIWDVIGGSADPEDLDDAGKDQLRRMLGEAHEARRLALANHPATQVLRREWKRLGIPDPGNYEDLDVIEEALRLAGIPTPCASANGATDPSS
jgi:hypothetical protein